MKWFSEIWCTLFHGKHHVILSCGNWYYTKACTRCGSSWEVHMGGL